MKMSGYGFAQPQLCPALRCAIENAVDQAKRLVQCCGRNCLGGRVQHIELADGIHAEVADIVAQMTPGSSTARPAS